MRWTLAALAAVLWAFERLYLFPLDELVTALAGDWETGYGGDGG